MFFLELKGNPNFQGILNWILQILHYSSQEWTKMFLNHKVLGEEKKDWIVTPVRKSQKTSTSTTKQNRFIQKNKKKASKKRYSMSFRSSHLKVLCKKGVLKNFTTCLFAYYWNRHQVVDKNLSIFQNPNIRKIALSSIFYFEKVLLFWRSINKDVLEWFLLITSKEYTLHIHWLDLQTFLVETIPHYVFDQKEKIRRCN